MKQMKTIQFPNDTEPREIVDAKAREDIEDLRQNITIEETDPTVPAWAKKPNPPTPAEIGAAPAGFGLGSSAVVPPNNSLNEVKVNGWYYASPSYEGAPTGYTGIGYGVVHTICRTTDCIVQEFYNASDQNIILGTPLKLIRIFNGNGWSEWEWVNPPMQQGVEYRTTERWGGSPVYTQLVHFGYAPNNSFKEKSINTNVFRLVSLQAHANTEDGRTLFANDVGAWSISNGNLRLETTSDKSTFYCYATIKYIKA